MKRQYDYENEMIKKQKTKEDFILNELSIIRQNIDKIELMMNQLINIINSNNINNIPQPFRNSCSYIG